VQIAEALEKVRKKKASPDKARILAYIDERPNQVFTRLELAKELGIKTDTVKRYLHQLRIAGSIKHLVVKDARIRFYGTAKAIDEFERTLEKESDGKMASVPSSANQA
jgi:predicted ArsR family transcriptional regulator